MNFIEQIDQAEVAGMRHLYRDVASNLSPSALEASAAKRRE